MKIDKRFQIERVTVSPHDGRYALQMAWLDVETRTAWATSGRALVRVPVEVRDGEVSGLVPIRAVKASRSRSSYQPVQAGKRWIRIGDSEMIRRIPRSPGIGNGDFPLEAVRNNLATAVEAAGSGTLIGINARYLLDLVEAMGGGSRGMGVAFLWVPLDKNLPVLVRDCSTLEGITEDCPIGAIMRVNP